MCSSKCLLFHLSSFLCFSFSSFAIISSFPCLADVFSFNFFYFCGSTVANVMFFFFFLVNLLCLGMSYTLNLFCRAVSKLIK